MRKSLLVASLVSSIVLLPSGLLLSAQRAQIGAWQMPSPATSYTFKMPKRMFLFIWPSATQSSSSVSSMPITHPASAPMPTFTIPQPRLAPTQSSVPFNRADSWFMLPRPQLLYGPTPSFGLPIMPPIVMPPHGNASSSVSSISMPVPPPRNKPAPPASSSMPSMPGGYCGDGTCNNGETSATCSMDCASAATMTAPVSYCGDAMCNGSETSATCPADCGTATHAAPPATGFCGDKTCGGSETVMSCPTDCGSTTGSMPWCGNGTCDGSESKATCPADC